MRRPAPPPSRCDRPPMPDNLPPGRPTSRYKFAAVSAVGVAMVALPLAQVLRYQHTELQAALAEQAALDPVARAVAVQQGLLAHRDVAGQVLRGKVALETERRARQGAVDERVAALAEALVVASDRTQGEFDALRSDWGQLAREVQHRTVSAPESDLAHRLLVEQALQIIDFVAVASSLGRGPDSDAALLASALTHGLPRLATEIAAQGLAAEFTRSGAGERHLAATEAAMARILGRLDQAIEDSPVPRPTLTAATAKARETASRYFSLLRAGSAEAAQAASAAVQAQSRLQEATHAAMAEALAARVDGVRTERKALWAQTALLALLAAVLLKVWARPSGPGPTQVRTERRREEPQRRRDATAAGRPSANPDSRDITNRLLQRLRRHDRDRRRGTRRDDAPAETLPPDET